jgi:hypothetical protein
MIISESLFIDQIKSMPVTAPKYLHSNEVGINPVYEDSDDCAELCPHEKKIWVLRTDLILAIGIKNGAVQHGNTNILDRVDPSMHEWITPGNRYGHPSLAVPEGTYDGTVYYAGWLRKNHNRIEIFLSSGRFQNAQLTIEQREIIEAYVAYKLMSAYGEQHVLFFDWSAEKNDIEFNQFVQSKPFPQDKKPRVYTPQFLQIMNMKLEGLHENNPPPSLAYAYDMELARIETFLNFQRVIEEFEREKTISESQLHRLKNLSLFRVDSLDQDLPSFDDFWFLIQSTFDECMKPTFNVEDMGAHKEQIKKAIYLLLDAGLPYPNDRDLCLWTSRFARNKATEFSNANDCATIGIAQVFLVKILYGSQGFSESLYKILNTTNPKYPVLSKLFNEAHIEIFSNSLNDKRTVHIFFQDSLTAHNYFWNIELLIARQRGAVIFLHKYDLLKKEWQHPINIDSISARDIFIRRRGLHPLDVAHEAEYTVEGEEKIWKKEFTGSHDENPIQHWSAPKTLTLGKMRHFFYKMQNYKQNSASCSEELESEIINKHT